MVKVGNVRKRQWVEEGILMESKFKKLLNLNDNQGTTDRNIDTILLPSSQT